MKGWGWICVTSVLLGGVGSSAAQDPVALVRRTFADGFYDVAARQAEDALCAGVTAVQSNELLVLAGRSYLAMGRLSNAVNVLQLVRGEGGAPEGYAEGLYWLGQAYEQQGDMPRALFSYEAALSEAPATRAGREAAMAAARIYLRRDQASRAYGVLSNAVARAGGEASVELHFALGQAALACRTFAEARRILEYVLAYTTDSVLQAYATCALGAAELALGEATNGVARLASLCATPGPALAQAMARYYLGHMALMRGATNEAREWLLPNVTNHWHEGEEDGRVVSVRTGFPIADSLLLLGQMALTTAPAEARRWLTRCVGEYPQAAVSDHATLALALLDVQEGAVERARQRVRPLTQHERQDIRVASLLLAGDLARASSNFNEAAELYVAAAVLASNETAGAEAQLRAAVAWCEAGNYAVAQKECEKLISAASSPVRDDAYIWAAWCLMQQDLLHEAQARLSEYVLLHPEGKHVALAQLHLGRLAMELGELERAEQYFVALATNATDRGLAAQAAYELGWVYVRQNRLDDGIAQFSRLLNEQPHSDLSDDVAFHIGELLFNRRDYELAERAFVTAVDQYPESPCAPAAAYWAAMAAFRRGAHEECLALLSNHWPRLATSGYVAEALLLRGDSHVALGEYVPAYRTYYAASVQGTGSYVTAEARLRMGECLLALTNVQAAISLFTELSEARRALTRARALVGLGEALRLAGDARGALSAWLRVLYDYREFAAPAEQALVRAARLYEALNEPERARQLYRVHGDVSGAAGPFSMSGASSVNNP